MSVSFKSQFNLLFEMKNELNNHRIEINFNCAYFIDASV